MRFKVMTYNIHSGTDKNNQYSLNRIVQTIKGSKADFIGLNEVVRNLKGSIQLSSQWSINQPAWLGKQLNYSFCFGKTYRLGVMNFFGNGFLSKYPVVKEVNYLLRGNKERRGCLRVEVMTPKGIINLLVVHLGLSTYDRNVQIEDINKIQKSIKGPKILMGDFNTTNEKELQGIESNLINIPIDKIAEIKGTFDTDNPKEKIDFIFYSKEFKPITSYPIVSDASDHLPLFSILELT